VTITVDPGVRQQIAENRQYMQDVYGPQPVVGLRKFKTGDGKPVVAIDIDGTLGDYHAHFLWFAEKWLGKTMPPADQVNPGMRLSEFMGIPHSEYKACKLAYRQGGLKRFMPAYPFAGQLTANIRMTGAELWICTTRPYLRLDNIDPDTREWLDRNHIEYDAVIFSDLDDSDKYKDLVRQVGAHRVVAAVDDLPEQLDAAVKSGIRKVYVRDQPYNREDPDGAPLLQHPEITTRVYTLRSLWYYLVKDIGEWRQENG
jgi:hypothetical protein